MLLLSAGFRLCTFSTQKIHTLISLGCCCGEPTDSSHKRTSKTMGESNILHAVYAREADKAMPVFSWLVPAATVVITFFACGQATNYMVT